MWGLIARGLLAGGGMMIKPVAGRLLGWLGFAAAGEIADQAITGGAVTNGILSTGKAIKATSDAAGGLNNMLQTAFNNVSSGMQRNGVFAAVPAAIALGLMSGNGIFDKLISTVVMGGLAYAGAMIADQNGINLPGLSSLFKSASIPAPANETPAAEMKAPQQQVLAPAMPFR